MEKTSGTETALVITGGFCNIEKIKKYIPDKVSLVVAADSGLETAGKIGIEPDIIMGDFDSFEGILPDTVPVYRVPAEKDDTDTMLACNYAIEKGNNEIVIFGGTGGRIDHSISNIFFLEDLKLRGVHAVLCDGVNRVEIIKDETVFIENEGGYFSVFALDSCIVSESGCKYPLSGKALERNNPFAVSNEVTDEFATVCVKGVAVLVRSEK